MTLWHITEVFTILELKLVSFTRICLGSELWSPIIPRYGREEGQKKDHDTQGIIVIF